MKSDSKNCEHLVQVLKTIKHINRIINKETELENLCNKVCNTLIINRGYLNAWLILIENDLPVQPYFHAGYGRDFTGMTNILDKGEIPNCGQKSLNSERVHVFTNPNTDCPDCPLMHKYGNKAGFSKSLVRNDIIIGWMTVSVPEEFAHDREEQELFADMVDDIGLAINNLRIQNQNKILESNYRAILDNTSDSIIELTNDGNIIFCNKKAGEFCRPDDSVNKTISIYELFPIQEKEGLSEAIKEAISNGSSLFISKAKILDTTGFIEVEMSLSYRKGNNPDSDRIISVIRNLTEREKAIQNLKESEERFKLLFDRAPLGYQSLDEDGNFIEVNQTWLDMLKYKKSDVTGHWFGEFLHPDYVESFRKRFPDFKEKGSIHSEFFMKNKSGEDRYISFEGRIGHNLDGSFQKTHCILSDQTEKKKADELLIESEAHFRNVFENINVGIAVYEPCSDCEDFLIIDMNSAGQKISKVSIDNIQGEKVCTVFPGIKEFGLFKVFQEVIQSGISQHHPVTQYKDQRVVAWIENHVSITPSGRLIAIYEDRTNQKILESKIRHFEKMELIGQMTGGIAHDFNNALSGIMSAAHLLKAPARGLDEKGLKYSEMILEASKRASDLSSKLLSFSRKKDIELLPQDLDKIIIGIKEILNSTHGNRIKISLDLGAEKSTVIGNESELHNCLLNLCINAIHAMNNRGELLLKTGNRFLDSDYCEGSNFSLSPGLYSWFEVTDKGAGIPSTILDKIFEPFYTTKKQGEGTGLGLSAVFSTVQSHNGAIEVESTIGKGSTFRIYLQTTQKNIKERTGYTGNSCHHSRK